PSELRSARVQATVEAIKAAVRSGRLKASDVWFDTQRQGMDARAFRQTMLAGIRSSLDPDHEAQAVLADMMGFDPNSPFYTQATDMIAAMALSGKLPTNVLPGLLPFLPSKTQDVLRHKFGISPAAYQLPLLTPQSVAMPAAGILGNVTSGAGAGGVQMTLDQALSAQRSEEHTSELQSRENLVCRLLL